MSGGAIRIWALIHKWSSLICTAFLLLICLTGLPLTFHEEIDHWIDPPPAYAEMPPETPHQSLDGLIGRAQALYPGETIVSLFKDDDAPQVLVWMAPSFAAMEKDPKLEHFIRFDARTGQVIEQSKPPEQQRTSFMTLMLRLHVDLFADLAGSLFMGAMGLLFVCSARVRVVLYGPSHASSTSVSCGAGARGAPAGSICTIFSASSPLSGCWSSARQCPQ